MCRKAYTDMHEIAICMVFKGPGGDFKASIIYFKLDFYCIIKI